MSVDFFDCRQCGRSVCQCGRYTSCETCYSKFCEDCAPSAESCPVCNLSFIPDHALVEFLLDTMGWTRSQAEDGYRAKMRREETT